MLTAEANYDTMDSYENVGRNFKSRIVSGAGLDKNTLSRAEVCGFTNIVKNTKTQTKIIKRRKI